MFTNPFKKKAKPKKYAVMSKLIGKFIAVTIAIIVIYAMIEMHLQRDLNSLPQLIISVFGIGATYVGFYLTMAKWEHVETEKTNRQKDIIRLKKKLECYNEEEQITEDIEQLQSEVEQLDTKEDELEQETHEGDY